MERIAASGLRWPIGVAAALAVAMPAAAQATLDDFLQVLTAAPYPLQVMAYCHGEIARDEAVLNAGLGWNERNGTMLANIEALAQPLNIPSDVRKRADEASLSAIETTIGGQFDKPAYCRTIAKLVDAGYYDIDRRADLKDALKRIFGKD